MNFKWENAHRKSLVSCVAILGLSTTLIAAPTGGPCKEKQPHFAFAYPRDLNLANPYDFYFYIEGLAMQGMESNLQFTVVDSSTTLTQPNGKLGGLGQDKSWDYNFGLRVGLGVNIDYDAWNLDFDWMWLNITDSISYEAGAGSTLPIWLPDSGATFVSRGSSGANWGCTVNVADAALGKPYHVSRKVVLNPHFGLRFAWIDQDYGVNFGGTSPATAVKFNVTNDFFGVGARVGVDTDWKLGYGFKLFSNISTSLLAGWFDTSQHFGVAGTPVRGELTSEPQQIVPNMDIAVGFDWGTLLGNCNYYFNLRAGYEFQMWWNQWNMRQLTNGGLDGNFTNVPVNGDLTLNGFTFRVSLDM